MYRCTPLRCEKGRNMIKAVIFDLNGVFLVSEYLSKRMHEKYGVDENAIYAALKEIMEKARQPGVENSFAFWQPHLEKLGLRINEDEFFNFWFSGEGLQPKLLEYIKQLRERDVKVFILSNNFKERTFYYRKKFPEIFKNTDGAYFSWETGFVKPNPEAYLNILAEQGLRPEECFYFDDSERNIEVATSLGINARIYEGLEKTRELLDAVIPLIKQEQ